MPLATIMLRDTPEGAIDFGLVFEGGFQKDSHAHQNANLIRKFMDHIAAESGQPAQAVPAAKDAAPRMLVAGESTDGARAAAAQAVQEMAELANRPLSDRIQIVQ